MPEAVRPSVHPANRWAAATRAAAWSRERDRLGLGSDRRCRRLAGIAAAEQHYVNSKAHVLDHMAPIVSRVSSAQNVPSQTVAPPAT